MTTHSTSVESQHVTVCRLPVLGSVNTTEDRPTCAVCRAEWDSRRRLLDAAGK